MVWLTLSIRDPCPPVNFEEQETVLSGVPNARAAARRVAPSFDITDAPPGAAEDSERKEPRAAPLTLV